MLTEVQYTSQNVKQIVEEFYNQSITTPGVIPQDFVAAIMQAKIISPLLETQEQRQSNDFH